MNALTSTALALAGLLVSGSAFGQTPSPGLGPNPQGPAAPQNMPGISGSGPGTLQPGTPGATGPQAPGTMPPGSPGTGTPSLPGTIQPGTPRTQGQVPTQPCTPQGAPTGGSAGQGLTPPPCPPGVGMR
jgi:hypothetical protein